MKKKPTSVPTTEEKPNLTFWRKNWIAIAILILAPLAIYWQSLGFEFVLDDKIVISENNYTKEGWQGIGKILSTDSFEGYLGKQLDLLEGGRYRPLSIVTFAIEYALFGLNPKVNHLNNILLYLFTGILLFRVLLLLLPPLPTNRWYLSLAFLTSLIFILHPIHTEAVANIKGRDEILALLMALGALYASIRYVEREKPGWLAGAALLLLGSILSKENGLSWILIIPLSLYCFKPVSQQQLLRVGGSLLGVGVVYLGIRYAVLGFLLDSGNTSTSIMNNPYVGLPYGDKLATIIYTLGLYLKLLIFPHPLTHDYYPYQIPILNWGDWRVLLSFAVNAGLLTYAIWNIRKKTVLVYGILFYFITLFIVSNLPVNVGTAMNERFVFMPSLGICLIMAYWISRWLPGKLEEKAGEVNLLSVGALIFILMGFIWKNLDRIPDWQSALTLNAAAVKYSPNSARANCFMGVAMFENYKTMPEGPEKNALLKDITYYVDRSLEILPDFSSALTIKAGIAAEQHKRDGNLSRLLYAFENILRYRTRVPFVDEYLNYVKKRATNKAELGEFFYRMGYEFNVLGRRDYNVALYYLGQAYELIPEDPQVNEAIAYCYQQKGDMQRAQQYLMRAQQ